jgi:hypothetical protein
MYSQLAVVALTKSERLRTIVTKCCAAVLAAMINVNCSRAVDALDFTTLQARSIRFSGEDLIPQPARRAGFTKMAFSENFGSLVIDDLGKPTSHWSNGMWYEPPAPKNRFNVHDGILTMTSVPGPNGTTTISTFPADGQPGKLFRWGYFEARMSWKNEADNWAAFWLFSADHARGIDKGSWCEIDIFEAYGRTAFVGTVHEWINFTDKQNKNHIRNLGPTVNLSDWHTYGLLHRPGEITWFLDNKPILTSQSPQICGEQDLFVVFTAQSHSRNSEQHLSLDWIRVFVSPLDNPFSGR